MVGDGSASTDIGRSDRWTAARNELNSVRLGDDARRVFLSYDILRSSYELRAGRKGL